MIPRKALPAKLANDPEFSDGQETGSEPESLGEKIIDDVGGGLIYGILNALFNS